MKLLIAVAQRWSAQHSRRVVEVAQPKLHARGGEARAYFGALREAMRVKRGERKAYILGLGPPWSHWTVVRRVQETDVEFFDSWAFPAGDRDAAPFRAFTFDRRARGVDTRKRFLIDAPGGFLLTSRPKDPDQARSGKNRSIIRSR